MGILGFLSVFPITSLDFTRLGVIFPCARDVLRVAGSFDPAVRRPCRESGCQRRTTERQRIRLNLGFVRWPRAFEAAKSFFEIRTELGLTTNSRSVG